MIELPKVKPFPEAAVQCDLCGGYGCLSCADRGWYPNELVAGELGRRCEYAQCRKPLRPDWLAVYCSNECALKDA